MIEFKWFKDDSTLTRFLKNKIELLSSDMERDKKAMEYWQARLDKEIKEKGREGKENQIPV